MSLFGGTQLCLLLASLKVSSSYYYNNIRMKAGWYLCRGPMQFGLRYLFQGHMSRSAGNSNQMKHQQHSRALTRGQPLVLRQFIFVGDSSVVNSIKLTAYHPRWAFGYFSIHLPKFLEIIFLSMLRVSASLGLLNCMPVCSQPMSHILFFF